MSLRDAGPLAPPLCCSTATLPLPSARPTAKHPTLFCVIASAANAATSAPKSGLPPQLLGRYLFHNAATWLALPAAARRTLETLLPCLRSVCAQDLPNNESKPHHPDQQDLRWLQHSASEWASSANPEYFHLWQDTTSASSSTLSRAKRRLLATTHTPRRASSPLRRVWSHLQHHHALTMHSVDLHAATSRVEEPLHDMRRPMFHALDAPLNCSARLDRLWNVTLLGWRLVVHLLGKCNAWPAYPHLLLHSLQLQLPVSQCGVYIHRRRRDAFGRLLGDVQSLSLDGGAYR